MHISNRKQFAGRALKMIAFVLLTVLLLVGMSKTLVPRSNSASGGMHNYRARGFYGEEKDSLDVVAIGNSDLASGFSPMELFFAVYQKTGRWYSIRFQVILQMTGLWTPLAVWKKCGCHQERPID